MLSFGVNYYILSFQMYFSKWTDGVKEESVSRIRKANGTQEKIKRITFSMINKIKNTLFMILSTEKKSMT